MTLTREPVCGPLKTASPETTQRPQVELTRELTGARPWHPDITHDKSGRKFKEVQEAYVILQTGDDGYLAARPSQSFFKPSCP